MKTVMVFGTFDGLHKGHETFLKKARSMGERLIVIIGTDRNVERFKLKRPLQNESKRLNVIGKLPYVDEAQLGDEHHDFAKLLRKYAPDIICLGYDQHSFGLSEMLSKEKLEISVKRLGPYKEHKYKSHILNP